MRRNICAGLTILTLALAPATGRAQEKLDKIRVARASDSATEAALWFTKEGGFFEKHGISAELIRFQGSSLVVSTMLAGEIAVSQIGAAAVVDADLAGGDLTNVATIIRNFVFYIFSRPEIERMADLKGKAMGTSRYGAISDFAARFALTKNGLQPEKDVAILQTGGPSESVAALNANRIQAVALTAPATIRARKLGLRPLLDISKIEANFPFNGIVVRKSFLKNNGDLMRRFMMAYIEGVALAKKDAAFAKKVMAKYFKSDDREILDESYDWIVKQNFTLPPYPAVPGLATILTSVAERNPKAKSMKPEDFVDMAIVQELDKSGFIANATK
jgi:NitT/TauT family transport system substrate-binding protein